MSLEEILKDIDGTRWIEIPELWLNRPLRDHGIGCKILLFNNGFVLRTDSGVEIHLCYHLHLLDWLNSEFSLTLRVLRVTPIY